MALVVAEEEEVDLADEEDCKKIIFVGRKPHSNYVMCAVCFLGAKISGGQ